MNFPDFIEKIILEKEYGQLTGAEKAELADWINDETEYNSIRLLLLKMNLTGIGEEKVSPSLQTTEKLKAAFSAKHNKRSGRWANKPAWVISAVAASVIIVLAAVFLLPEKSPVVHPQLSEVKKEVPDAQASPEKEPLISLSDTQIAIKPGKKTEQASLPEPIRPGKEVTNSVALADQPDLEELTVVVF